MIGLFNGSPVISFGQVDPARPPVVVTGGTQLLVVSPGIGGLCSSRRREIWSTGAIRDQDPYKPSGVGGKRRQSPGWTQLQACTHPDGLLGPADPTDEKGQVIRIDYRLSPSWDDPPCPWEYTAELCFTLSPDLEPLHSWVYPTPFTPGGGGTSHHWLLAAGEAAFAGGGQDYR